MQDDGQKADLAFVCGHFEKRNRSIAPENVEWVYNLFKGHTYYIQRTFNEAFADTSEGEECTREIIEEAIDNMVASNDNLPRDFVEHSREAESSALRHRQR